MIDSITYCICTTSDVCSLDFGSAQSLMIQAVTCNGLQDTENRKDSVMQLKTHNSLAEPRNHTVSDTFIIPVTFSSTSSQTTHSKAKWAQKVSTKR